MEINEIQKRFFNTQPNTFDEDTLTIQAVISTGERYLRKGFKPYYEELEISEQAIDLSRLNTGAPLLKDHGSNNIENVIGIVEQAYILENSLIAKVRFSDREDVKGIIQDVKNGILRNLSIGYTVEEAKQVGEFNKIPIYRVTKWTPMEVSIVTIPADLTAKFRSLTKEEEMKLKEVTGNIEGIDVDTEEKVSIEINDIQEDTSEADPTAETILVENTTPTENSRSINPEEIIATERKRISDINLLVRQCNLDSSIADEMIGTGMTLEQTRSALLDKVIGKQPMIQNTNTVVDSSEKLRNGVEQAILIRAGFEKNDPSNEFRGDSLVEMAKRFLVNEGKKTTGNKIELVGRAFTSTSDFPLVLGNIANKSLRVGYEECPVTWDQWTKTLSVPDFKPQTIVALSEFGLLDEMAENAEYKHGSFSDAKETVSIGTFGKMFAISRQAIINDDTGAFTRIPQAMGAAAKRTLNKSVYDRLFAATNMQDGSPLFHANHSNLGSGALTVAAIDAGRVLMSKQKDLANSAFLNITPNIILVPKALFGTAQILMTSQFDPDATNKLQRPNIVAGTCTVVSDPLLDVNSATAFYLVGTQFESIVVAFLDGNQTPYTETQQGWNIDGVEMKIRLDWGVAAVDHRSIYKSTGV